MSLSVKDMQAVWEKRSNHLEVVETQTAVNKVITCNSMNNLNNIISCDNITYNMVSKQEYTKIISQLERWNVWTPKRLVKINGPQKVKEAISRTKYKNLPDNESGKYFRRVLDSLN